MARRRALPLLLIFWMVSACGTSPEDGAGTGVSSRDASGLAVDGAPASTDGARPGAASDGASTADGGPTDAPCTHNASRCSPGNAVEICRNGVWTFIKVCQAPLFCGDGFCQSGAGCEPGKVLGCLDDQTIKRCAPEGIGAEGEPCPEGSFCLDGACGEKRCFPFDGHCRDANTIEYCNPDGMGYEAPMTCGEGSICINGTCLTGCEADYKFGSNVGCEYWTVDLDQYEDPFGDPEPIPHAIVIANPGLVDANLSFESFSSIPVQIATPVVPGGSVVAFEMPRHDLDGSGVFNRSIRVRSSTPVLAAQFNPLNNVNVASNDGTLLLPLCVLGTDHFVLSWPSGPDISAMGLPIPSFPPQKGYLTVVAVRRGTTKVSVVLTANVEATLDAVTNDVVVPVTEHARTRTATYELQQGQVLQLTAAPITSFFGQPHDLTGSRVLSDRPVAVFGSHEEAVVAQSGAGAQGPDINSEEDGSCCAEHIEEQMPPTKALGREVVCAHSPPRGDDPDLWRIIAVDPLQLSTDPPQTTVDGTVVTDLALQTGEWIEIYTEDSFVATGTGRILVRGQPAAHATEVTGRQLTARDV